MSGFAYRDAKSFYCECGVRYLWEKRIPLLLLAYHAALLLVEVFEDALISLAMRVGEIVEGVR